VTTDTTTGSGPEPTTEIPEAELLHRVLDGFEDGVLAVGGGGEIRYLNAVACEVFGIGLDEVRGKPVGEILASDETDWLTPVLDDRVGDPSRNRETALRVGDKEVVIESMARPLLDRRGRAQGVVVTFRDVSDIAEDEEFRRTAERLAHLGELSAVVAHEIRNPLTGIRTTIQFLDSKLEEDHPMHDSLGEVIQELDRIEKIITDLLVLARPPRGSAELIDLNQLLDTGLDRVMHRVEEAGITLKKDLASDLPNVEVDEATALQVFSNMLVNAIDALVGVDDPALRVSTALRRYRVKRPTVEVSFSDSGCGIPAEVKDRIFDPFFTMKSMGTGLGLPLSLQIMKDHGGTIHVRNRPQGGTIFKLQFPVPEGFEDDR